MSDLSPFEDLNQGDKGAALESSKVRHNISLLFDYYKAHNRKFWGDHGLLQVFFDNSFRPINQNLFDYRDSFLGNRNEVNSYYMNTDFSKLNTFVFSWFNNLTRLKKINYLRGIKSGDSIEVSENILSLNVDQGVHLDRGGTFFDKLTRLAITFNANLFGLSFGGAEYYFYKEKKNIAQISVGKNFGSFGLSTSLFYDSKTTPISKIVRSNGHLQLSSELRLKGTFEYDIGQDLVTNTTMKVRFLPKNDCWFLDFDWSKNLVEQRYFFNFVLNYNREQFERLKVF